MSDIIVFSQVGIEHIADWQGYDHMLFLLALCGGYCWKQWKPLLWLITAFTLGHSLSLALATLQWVPFSSSWVEFLIPVTIFITCLSNLRPLRTNASSSFRMRYAMAGIFGLIHGLGFSTYLTALMGREASILFPLLGFNLGLELGQILIVGGILLVSTLVVHGLQFPRRDWNLFITGGATALSILLISQNIFW